MTEKRFTVIYNEQSIMMQYVDNCKEEPNAWAVWNTRETAQKLNELSEENKQLKEKNKCLLDNLQSNNEINKEIVEDILKENNQLKQENNDLIKLINDLGNGEMDRQMEEILND